MSKFGGWPTFLVAGEKFQAEQSTLDVLRLVVVSMFDKAFI